jgi:N-acetylglutamate synthase-like GNAT family acetyltransferase
MDWEKVEHLAESLGLDKYDMHPAQFKVCKSGNEVLGIGRFKKHPDCMELCTLGVVETHRNKGIGSALVEALLMKVGSPVYIVTEIPVYFEKLGFARGGEGIVSLEKKRNICLNELSCEQPVIMVKNL